MANELEPEWVAFWWQNGGDKTSEDVGIPLTYVSANYFDGYMVGGYILPLKESVILHGDYTNQGYMQSGFVLGS